VGGAAPTGDWAGVQKGRRHVLGAEAQKSAHDQTARRKSFAGGMPLETHWNAAGRIGVSNLLGRDRVCRNRNCKLMQLGN